MMSEPSDPDQVEDDPPVDPDEAEPPAPAEEGDGGDQVHEVEDPEALIAKLEERLEEAASLADRRTNTLAKVQADFENYRKRAKRERQEAARDARIGLIKLLVELLDDVDRAKQAGEEAHPVVQGLTLMERKVRDRLTDLGVTSIAPEPEAPFDPSVHEALMTVETDEQEPETIIEVLATGYELDGKLVRPAMVRVARGPVEEGDE